MEFAAAILIMAEIVILFGGVVARYVFGHPLVWSDELASILFLWLAMLGAAIAFRRDEHMRMTAAVGLLRPRRRAALDITATAAALLFLLLLAWPAFQYVLEELAIITPALEIKNAWRAAALPCGMVLMAAFAVLRLARAEAPATVALACGGIAVLAAAFWLARPVFFALGNFNLSDILRRHRGRAGVRRRSDRVRVRAGDFGLSRADHKTPLIVLVGRIDEGMSHLILLAVPLFVFLGLLIEMTGMARAMVAFPRQPARPRPRRPVLCADRRDVSGLRHFRREGGRHGRGSARAVSGNESARRESRATWWRCWPRPARRPRPSRRAWC